MINKKYKTCRVCKIEKVKEQDFYPKGTRGYYASECKVCNSLIGKAYHANNKDKCAVTSKAWTKANPDKRRATQARYRLKHKASIAAKDKVYREANPDKALLRGRKYRLNNSELVRARCNAYKKNNREICRALEQKRRTLLTAAGGSYTAGQWLALCSFYDNHCVKCWRGDVKLTVDHIIPISKGGTSDISNIQPLCTSCNCSKHATTADYRNI